MSWNDKVPMERITCRKLGDGTMDEAIRDVLSEAIRDPMFPRLQPVTVPRQDAQDSDQSWAPGHVWVGLRLLSLSHVGMLFGDWLDRNEAIFGLLAVSLVPGGPLVDTDMRARRGLRMTPRSLSQSRLLWWPPLHYRQEYEPGRLEILTDVAADPDPCPLDLDALVRFGSRNLWEVARGIYTYDATGAYYDDLFQAARAVRTATDTMLAGLPGGSEDNTQQGEQT